MSSIRTSLVGGLVCAMDLLLGASAFAQVPFTIGYQGRLTKADGTPESGVIRFEFSLWSTETGGTSPAWSEVQSPTLSDGYYATFLGDMEPLQASDFDGSDMFLEIRVNGETLSPRQRVASVPYALVAASASNIVVNGRTVIDADGIDYTLLKACTSVGESLEWGGSGWVCKPKSSLSVGSPIVGDGSSGSPLTIPAASIDNSLLTQPSLTVTAGQGLAGGGVVPLGGSVTLANTGVLGLIGGGGITVSGSGMIVLDTLAGGDLSGTLASATVARLGGLPVSLSGTPARDSALKFSTTTGEWIAADWPTVAAGAGISIVDDTVSVNFGGSGVSDLAARADHTHPGSTSDAFFNNLARNGSMELFANGTSTFPDFWEKYGNSTVASNGVAQIAGNLGAYGLQVTDLDSAAVYAVKQMVYASGAVPSRLLGRTVTLTVWARKSSASSARGRVGLADSGPDNAETSVTWVDLPSAVSTTWAPVTVAHRISPGADYLEIILSPTTLGNDSASYDFDGAMLSEEGSSPSSFDQNPLFVIDGDRNVGLGNFDEVAPAAKLDVAGSVKIGNSGDTCDKTRAGTIRWNEGMFQGCNGARWIRIDQGHGDGSVRMMAAQSCAAIRMTYPYLGDGLYWLDPNEGDFSDAFQTYCDMTRDGGGWTLGIKNWYGAIANGTTGAVGSGVDGLSKKGAAFKLSDQAIRDIIGPLENFDVMADQAGYNSSYSTGNYEYVILRNYTARWTFGGVVPASSTQTTMASYRLSDNARVWQGELTCGYAGGAGINCYPVVSNNPAGGGACSPALGSSTNTSWHHFFMSETNTDTYLYICNGAQHSSGQDMNHRWWFRARR